MSDHIELATKVIQLPGGFLTKDDTVVTEAEVTEYTGQLQVFLAAKSAKKDPAQAMRKVLESVLVRVGGDDAITPIVLNRLLLGDMEFILSEARRLSRGDTVLGRAVCSTCNTSLDIEFDLGDLDIIELTDEARKNVSVNALVFSVKDDELGIDALFRYPTVADSSVVLEKSRVNEAEGQYALLAAICVEWNGDKGRKTTGWFQRLPVRITDFIFDELAALNPGPRLMLDIVCSECGATTSASMENSDFLFPNRRKRRRLR